MRALLQRVLDASVSIDGAVHSTIGRGILLLLGVAQGDGDAQLEALAKKIAGLRIFDDAQGKTNLSCEDIGGEFSSSPSSPSAPISPRQAPGIRDGDAPARLRAALSEILRAAGRADRTPGQDRTIRRLDGGVASQRRSGDVLA
jgi:hypothetical protein